MMQQHQIEHMQRHLGVTADGVIGRGTLTALFMKCGADAKRAKSLAIGANVHFRDFGILERPNRLIHMMAQLMHESARFVYMEEIASGQDYEGRTDLGNTQPGDGRRYKGRGPLQITGRANYRAIGNQIGIDLESDPQLAAIPSIGIHTACVFWKNNGLEAYADDDNLMAVSNGVNRGNPRSTKLPNGWEDRKVQYAKIRSLVL